MGHRIENHGEVPAAKKTMSVEAQSSAGQMAKQTVLALSDREGRGIVSRDVLRRAKHPAVRHAIIVDSTIAWCNDGPWAFVSAKISGVYSWWMKNGQ